MTNARKLEPDIPISRVTLPEASIQRVARVLESGHLAQGAEVAELESRAAAMAGTEYAIAVSNGTVSLELALRALGLPEQGEVVTSAFTFAGTINAILNAGMRVRFADIEDDFLVSERSVAAALTAETVAVIPVHLYGLACNMTELTNLAISHQLHLIEDAAQAHGAQWLGRPVGSFEIGSFSLYATKNLTSGEGGLLTTNDPEVAQRIRVLRNQGMRSRYEFEAVGTNARMTDLQAAVAIPQFDQLEVIIASRRANAASLTARLQGLPGIVCPARGDDPGHVFHQYTVRVTKDAPIDRNQLLDALKVQGVTAGVYYPRPVFDYEVYRSHPRVMVGECPNAERASIEVLSLPVHPTLTANDLDRIAGAVRTIVESRC